MRKKRTIPDNPKSSFLLFVLTGGGFLLYLAVFFCQPSAFGFTSEDGQALDRLTDLLVMPSMMQGVFSGGAELAGLFDRLPLLLAVVAWSGLGYWLGRPMVGLAPESSRPLQTISLSMLFGWAILSTTTFAVGLAGGLGSRLPLTLAILALVGLSATFFWAMRRWPRTDASTVARQVPTAVVDTLRPQSLGGLWLTRLIPVVTCLLAACYLLGSFVPPWEFDVLEYHLQSPKEFWQAGGIHFMEHNVYANMPLGAEMHSLAMMTLIGGESGWWWGGLIGKSIIAVHSLLAAALVASFVTQRFGKACGWASAGLLLAAPGNAHVAMAGLIDMAFGAYLIAMLVTAAQVFPRMRAGQGSGWAVFLVVFFAGAAAACKYTGLLFAIIPMFVAIIYFNVRLPVGGPWEHAKRCCKLLVPFLLALGLTVVPWWAKNTVATGNPVYPLAYQVFGGRALSDTTMERWQRVHSPQRDGNASAYSVGAILQSSKQLLVRSPFINPSLVFLALVGVSAGVLTKTERQWMLAWLALLIWILFVWFFATHRIDRFWLPALPIAAVLAAFGAAAIARRVSVTLASGIVFFGLGYGLLQVSSGVGPADTRFFVPLSDIERESREENTGGVASPLTAWANSNLSQSDRVLSIGEARAYLYRIPIVYATCFNENPGEQWLYGKSTSQQQTNLLDNGITHIIVSWKEIDRYRSPGNYGFSRWPEHADIDAMVKSGVVTRLAAAFDRSEIEILSVSRKR